MAQVKEVNGVEAKGDTTIEAAAQVGLGVTVASAGLIGLWGAACFLSALAQNGVIAMAKGWFMAVGG
ncbi:MAG: hypothetical protein ABFR97_10490 [Thermodesulfobacteriota bacterium]